ncbi:hypothetical protein Tco_0250386 [Tanacetum coccineum]
MFRSMCYPTKDGDDLEKMKPKTDIKYYATRILKLSNDSVANTLDNEDTPSSSLIVVEENEAPQVVTSSEEQVVNEQTTSVSTKNANEPVQEDIAAFDGNDFYNLFHTPVFEEAKSSSTF